MSTFFREITETVPSLFCGIFSERNSVPNPRWDGGDWDGRWKWGMTINMEFKSIRDMVSQMELGE
jgi:hypothetical protein